MFLRNVFSVLLSAALAFALSALLTRSGIRSPHSLNGIGFLALLFFGLNTVYLLNRGSKSFSQLLLFGISVKLLICFFAVFLYSLLNHSDFFGFAMHFVLNYFLFTVFEVRYLMQLIKNNPAGLAKEAEPSQETQGLEIVNKQKTL